MKDIFESLVTVWVIIGLIAIVLIPDIIKWLRNKLR
jgi:hypothetical protein